MSSETPRGSRVADLKKGTLLAVNNKYRVSHVDDDWVNCTTVGTGDEIRFSKSLVESAVFSAEQHKVEKKVTATELAKVIESAGHAVFTCVFTKKPTAKAAADYLKNDPDLSTASKRRKIATDMLTGETRTLRGCLARDAPVEQGRVSVLDLEIEDDKHQMRLIDLRTIKSIVIENVRYVLKK